MNDVLLQQYMSKFAGYGNLDGDYWFVGMEEGGGNSVEEVERRINIWKDGGQYILEDVKLYHDKIGETRWFEPSAKLQPTWNKLIRIIHGIKSQIPTTEDVRDYQSHRLARYGEESCLLELMPLPSPSTNHWLYKEISCLPELVSREKYLNHWGPIRRQTLGSLIDSHKPKNIVFYGMGYYQDWWSKLMPSNHKRMTIDGVTAYLGKKDETVFAVSPHPVATGVKNTFFHELGLAMMKM